MILAVDKIREAGCYLRLILELQRLFFMVMLADETGYISLAGLEFC